MRRVLLPLLVLATAAAAAVPARAAFVYAGAGGGGGGGSIVQFQAGAGGLLAALAPASVATPAAPAGLTVSPDGAHLYAALEDGSIAQYAIGAGGALQPLSPATVTAGGALIATGIAGTPDGRHVYVPAFDGTTSGVLQLAVAADGTLSPLSPALVPADGAWAVAVDPAGRHAYAVDGDSAGGIWQFSIADDGTLRPLSTPRLAAGFKPSAIAIAPDGGHVYVGENAHDLLQFAVGADGALAPLSPPTVALPDYPVSVTVSPDGRSVYATELSGVAQLDVGADGTLSPKAPSQVAAGAKPWGLAVAPDGRTVYTSDALSGGTDALWQHGVGADGLLQALSPSAVDGEASAGALVATPAAPPTAAFSVHAAAPGAATAFDGSASAAPSGTIARYAWDFGDGAAEADGGATTSHVYARAGTYTATLTVTDANGCSTAPLFAGQSPYCPGSPAARAQRDVVVAAPAAAPPAATPVVSTPAAPRHRTHRRRARTHARPRTLRLTLPAGRTWCVGCAQPSRRAVAVVRRLRRRARGALRVTIVSYADARGTRAQNLALTRRRTRAIAHLLLRRLSPRPRRVVLRAFGEAHPVASNATPWGRARNRRTVVTIVLGPARAGRRRG